MWVVICTTSEGELISHSTFNNLAEAEYYMRDDIEATDGTFKNANTKCGYGIVRYGQCFAKHWNIMKLNLEE